MVFLPKQAQLQPESTIKAMGVASNGTTPAHRPPYKRLSFYPGIIFWTYYSETSRKDWEIQIHIGKSVTSSGMGKPVEAGMSSTDMFLLLWTHLSNKKRFSETYVLTTLYNLYTPTCNASKLVERKPPCPKWSPTNGICTVDAIQRTSFEFNCWFRSSPVISITFP